VVVGISSSFFWLSDEDHIPFRTLDSNNILLSYTSIIRLHKLYITIFASTSIITLYTQSECIYCDVVSLCSGFYFIQNRPLFFYDSLMFETYNNIVPIAYNTDTWTFFFNRRRRSRSMSLGKASYIFLEMLISGKLIIILLYMRVHCVLCISHTLSTRRMCILDAWYNIL